MPFFHVSGSEFDEIFVGTGAKRVRQLFSKSGKDFYSLIEKNGYCFRSSGGAGVVEVVVVEIASFLFIYMNNL